MDCSSGNVANRVTCFLFLSLSLLLVQWTCPTCSAQVASTKAGSAKSGSSATMVEVLRQVQQILLLKKSLWSSSKLVKQDIIEDPELQFVTIQEGFGTQLATRLLALILSPQAVNFREFFSQLIENFYKLVGLFAPQYTPPPLITLSTSTAAPPAPPFQSPSGAGSNLPPGQLHQSRPHHAVQVDDTRQGQLGNSKVPASTSLGSGSPARSQLTIGGGQQHYGQVQQGIRPVTNNRVTGFVPEIPTFAGGGNGGVVGALVRGVVKEFVDVTGLANTTTVVPPYRTNAPPRYVYLVPQYNNNNNNNDVNGGNVGGGANYGGGNDDSDEDKER